MKSYKIWVHIEAIDEEEGSFIDLVDEGLVEPVSLGEYPKLATAWRQVLESPGYIPHPSDKAVLSKADAIEKEIWSEPPAKPPAAIGSWPQPPTRAGKSRYIRQGGVLCLFCDSDQLEGGPFECEEGRASQEMRCPACGQEWQDVYRLVAVQNPDWKQ